MNEAKRYIVMGVWTGIASVFLVIMLYVLVLLLGIKKDNPPQTTQTTTSQKNSLFSVEILSPEKGAQVMQGDRISFEGRYTETNGKKIDFWKDRMEWTSDRDGLIGRGDRLDYPHLTTGLHNITFEVKDEQKHSAKDVIQVMVRPDPAVTNEGADTFLRTCNQQHSVEEQSETSNACLYEIISKLAVWNREKAKQIMTTSDYGSSYLTVYENSLYEYAKSTRKSELCKELTDSEFREGCYVSIATFNGDVQMCEQAGSRKGTCFYWVASKLRDLSLCPKADDPTACQNNINSLQGRDTFYY